jgi:hypothetical protein
VHERSDAWLREKDRLPGPPIGTRASQPAFVHYPSRGGRRAFLEKPSIDQVFTNSSTAFGRVRDRVSRWRCG